MTKLVHGGDIYTPMENGKDKREILDYSANINPLGVPEGVKAAMAAAIDGCDSYPDPLCRSLRRAVAAKEELPEDYFIFGNGAADLIFRLAAAVKPAKAMVLAPTFAEYEKALSLGGCSVVRHRLAEEDGFELTEDFISYIDDDLEMIFLCNPNNPTGRLISGGLLERIIGICAAKRIFIVVDECFIDFLDEPDKVTVKKQTVCNPYLFVLRAFTKNYAIPGIRLGYGICGNRKLLESVFAAGQPWSVSYMAQEAGISALKEDEYLKKARRLVFTERKRLTDGLRALGYRVFEPAANYIFFRLKSGKPPEYTGLFAEDMSREGILIRSCENYYGLGEGFFRIAVRTEEENKMLLEKLNRREQIWQRR